MIGPSQRAGRRAGAREARAAWQGRGRLTALALGLLCLCGCGAGREPGPDPATAEGRLELAQRALVAGRSEQAVQHAREATRLRPAWAPAQTLLGQALRAGSGADRTEEVAAFERAVELAPGSVSAWANLVEAYRRSGRPERAAQALERLLQLGAGQPWAAELGPHAEPTLQPSAPKPPEANGGPDGDRAHPPAEP